MIEVNNTVLGLVAAAVPLLIIGFFILRRLPWIFAFFVALLAVGLGYLETTGAMRDFGHKVRTVLPEGVLKNRAHEAEPAAGPAMAPAETPAAETPASPPADEPAATPPAASEPSAPAPEATPAPEQAPAKEPEAPAPAPETTPPAEPAPSQSQPSTTP